MLKLRKKIPLFKTKAISRVGIHSYKTLFLIKDLSGNPGSLSSPLCCLSWIVSRRESERRNHSLARHADILAAVETRLSLLNMTFMKYVDSNLCCFIPGKVRSSASGPQDSSKSSLTDRGPFEMPHWWSCQFSSKCMLITALFYAMICFRYTQIIDKVLALCRGQKWFYSQPVKKMEESLRDDITRTIRFKQHSIV